MKFLITGDLHCHSWRQFSYVRKDGINSRLYNCAKVFDVLREEAKARGIKRILINGDLFEDTSYIEVQTYDLVYRRLERCADDGLEVAISLGNHDVQGESGGRILHALRPFRRVATIVEEPTLLWDCVEVVPWNPSPDRIKATIKSLDTSKAACLVLHCGVQGATAGPKRYLVRNPIKLADIRHREFGLVFLSDYHTRQRLAKNVWYIGSPLQHTFGEVHRPCIWAVSVDRDGVVKTEKIYTDFPRFRRVKATNKSDLYEATRSFQGDYIRISSRNSLSDRECELVAKEVGFQYQIERSGDESEEEPKSISSFQIEKVIRQYVRSHVKKELKRSRLISLGQKVYNGEL